MAVPLPLLRSTLAASADIYLIATGAGVPVTCYTISTSATPSAGGNTSGGGTVNSGDSVTVVASANGYNFSNWTKAR
jgi:hypothetical protein